MRIWTVLALLTAMLATGFALVPVALAQAATQTTVTPQDANATPDRPAVKIIPLNDAARADIIEALVEGRAIESAVDRSVLDLPLAVLAPAIDSIPPATPASDMRKAAVLMLFETLDDPAAFADNALLGQLPDGTSRLLRAYRGLLLLDPDRRNAIVKRLPAAPTGQKIAPAQFTRFLTGDFDATRPLTDYTGLKFTDAVRFRDDAELRGQFIALSRGNEAASNNAAPTTLWREQAKFLSLPLAQRQSILATFNTARAAQASLEAQAKAAREVRRQREREARNRLRALLESQAQAVESIARQDASLNDIRAAGAIWPTRVRDVVQQNRGLAEQQFEADRLYTLIVAELKKTRAALGTELNASPQSKINLRPPALDPILLQTSPANSDLIKLQTRAQRGALQLDQKAQDLRWRSVLVLRSNMRDMNQARLVLLDHLSPAKARLTTGFGPEGRAQARRELSQITLEARFQLARFRHLSGGIMQLLRDKAFSVVLILAQLLLILAVFRIWRRYGDDLLKNTEEGFAKNRNVSAFAVVATPVFRYIRKMRPPLDWWLLVILLNWLDGTRYDWTGIGFFWLVASWILGGAAVVRLIDAIASRRSKYNENQELRLKSLRLIATTIVAIGLILSLSLHVVGSGTIFAWVQTISWLLLIPAILLLSYWWRERIFALTRLRAENSPLLAVCLRWFNGPFSIFATVFAGILLFIGGLRMYFVRIASDIALIRQVFDYSYRRKVVAQADSAAQKRVTSPLPGEIYAKFSPIVRGREYYEIEGFREPLEDLKQQVSLSRNRVCAIVGERGSGKSEFLNQLQRSHDAERSMIIGFEEGHFDEVQTALVKSLGLRKNASLDKIDAALSARDIDIICIENAQRLIKPKIGGLEDFDRLIKLTQKSQSETLWVISVGGPAWQFLKRARGDRAVFDFVQMLQPWSVSEIETFIMGRCAEAGIVPDFSYLDLPPQIDLDQDMSAAERVRRDYFRFLTDQVQGNPAMALEYWRRSLAVDQLTGAICVHILVGPGSAMLDALPNSTLFVLRAALQMELASEADIIACTDMAPVVVSEAIRALHGAGVLERVGDLWRLDLYWYREASASLQRRNLLTR